MKLPVLPVYYYLDHFVEMLDFVRATYGSILTDEHDAFFARFQGLSKDAQCLLIRMINRRGAIFNRALFKYPEITELDRAASELMACGHARTLQDADYAAFVSCLPRDVLVTGAQAAGRSDMRKSWSKPKLVDYFLSQIPFAVAFEHCTGGNLSRLPTHGRLNFCFTSILARPRTISKILHSVISASYEPTRKRPSALVSPMATRLELAFITVNCSTG